MVDPAPDSLGAIAPFHPVVERTAGEEDDSGEGEDSESYAPTQVIGDRYEGQSSDQADGAHDQMDNSPQFRGKRASFRLARVVFLLSKLIHVSTIAQMGRKSDPESWKSDSACR